MGLLDGADDFDAEEQKSDSSSTKSSGSSTFPKYERRCPQAVLAEVKGGYELRKYPETVAISFKKDWYTASWEPADHLPGEWVEHWWSKDSYNFDKMVYEEIVGSSFEDDLVWDGEKTIKKLRTARQEYESDNNVQEAKQTRTCPVCEELVNIRYGDYQEIGNSVVHEQHSVAELKDAGVFK